MYAIIESGSKQYKVEAGNVIDVELLGKNAEEAVEFDKVVLFRNENDVKIGQPYISGVKVLGKVVANIKDDKVTTYKYKNKTNYHRTKGHRQNYTRVQIEAING
ncbi:MAG: 50S ribosomal protein L21 [Candidatus Saganbacteria bacterium]|nr:50S ribosomal protein L21 [Candidatus Saganbacteria bacterium]